MPLTKYQGLRPRGVVLSLFATLGTVGLLAQPPGPQLLLSTYFGGTGADAATVVRVDAAGNYYLAGSTTSRDFPTRNSVFPLPPATGSTPAVGFLTKLRADGSIVYSTYLARPPAALAIDADGNVVMADNMPNFIRGRAIGDAVISKLDPNGVEMFSVRLAGSGLDQAVALAADEAGSVVITGNTDSPDFPLLNALQPAVLPGDDGFDRSAFITKLDGLGRMVFSTGWGGTGEDLATAVAIDRHAIYVAGSTRSVDFPTTLAAFQRTLFDLHCTASQSPCADAFVSKFSPDGQAVMYSTLFGGTETEAVRSLAVDAAGSVHLAGTTASPDLPLSRAIQTTCDSARRVNGCSDYIAKLNPAGTALEYATYFGSRGYYVSGLGLSVTSLSIDRDGGLVMTGVTHGNDLPPVQPLAGVNGGGPLFKSTDEGRSWTAASDGITGSGIWFLASGGRASQTLYASTFEQLFRSEDQSRHWIGPPGAANSPSISTRIAVDPLAPTTLYTTGATGLLESVDGGVSWTRLPLETPFITHVTLAPSSPSNLYVAASRGVFHSANGGITWSIDLELNPPDRPPGPGAVYVAVDPRDPAIVYAGISDGSVRRKDGSQWSPVGSVACPVNQLLFAPAPPSTIYALACGNVWRSVDGARSWREMNLGRMAASIAVDASLPDDVYAAAGTVGIYRSRDRGETWTLVSDSFDHDLRSILVDPYQVRTIYAGATDASNAFVARFDPFGAVTFSTYLGGLQSSGSSVTVSSDSAIVVAGSAGRDFPLVHPLDATYHGGNDAFLTRIRLPN